MEQKAPPPQKKTTGWLENYHHNSREELFAK